MAGVHFLIEVNNFSHFDSVQTDSGVHPVSYPVGIWGSFPREVKWPMGQPGHSPPSSAKFKNGGAIHPFPHTSSWHGA
jgi:hypothetical protein